MAINTIHTFKESLQKGQEAERIWLAMLTKHCPEYVVEHSCGRKHDFILYSPFGSFTVELKSDSHDMAKTKNIFIERWSDYDKKKPGGPYQSTKNNVDIYAYWHPKNKIMLTFSLSALIIKLGELKLKDKDLIPIFNRGFITKGWKVPRKDLEDVCTTTIFSNDSITIIRPGMYDKSGWNP